MADARVANRTFSQVTGIGPDGTGKRTFPSARAGTGPEEADEDILDGVLVQLGQLNTNLVNLIEVLKKTSGAND